MLSDQIRIQFLFKRFHIFHLLYVHGHFVPISNSSYAKGPASFCVFLKNRTMKIQKLPKFALFNDIVKEEGQCHWTRNSHWGFYLLFSWAVQGPPPLHTENDVSLLFERPDLSQDSKCNCLVGTEVLPALSNRQLKNRKGNLKKSFSK